MTDDDHETETPTTDYGRGACHQEGRGGSSVGSRDKGLIEGQGDPLDREWFIFRGHRAVTLPRARDTTKSQGISGCSGTVPLNSERDN